MTSIALVEPPIKEGVLLSLVSEIAKDIQPLKTILETHHIDARTWETIRNMPAFQRLLEAELLSWNSAMNVHERVKIKSATLMEIWLETAHEELHNKSQPLNSRTELAKLIQNLAGLGGKAVDATTAGEKFSVIINLGADQQLRIEKPLPARVIDHAEDQ